MNFKYTSYGKYYGKYGGITMQQAYPHLFSPITIGGVTFRNRIFVAPSNNCLQAEEHYPTEAAIRYYANKARGGAALVNCGTGHVDPEIYIGRPQERLWNQYHLHNQWGWRYFAQQADAVHAFGAKAALEAGYFKYGGYEKFDQDNGRVIYGPSDMQTPDGINVKQMPVGEMERIAKCFADYCENAYTCGFDMILIHAGHGLGIAQFLSPETNHRTDEFGGSTENRTRFLNMILDAIRQRVGRRLLLDLRISGDECSENGLHVDEVIEIIKLVQDKIDMVHVSKGGDHLEDMPVIHPSGFIADMPNAYLAKAVKACSDIKIPVLTLGGMNNPEEMDKIIENGEADVIAMARSLIADPEFPNKARTGAADEIIPCVKCFNCLNNHSKTHMFTCSVNPKIGREHRIDWQQNPVTSRKKVVVIGGGPGGMYAAMTAWQRGHEVTLIEKNDYLGGSLRFADYAVFKRDLAAFKNKLAYILNEKSDVKVMLGAEATPELVGSMNPDVVITALGANPILLPIPGKDHKKIIYASYAYQHLDEVAKDVVIIGGGQVGLETALHLAQNDRNVTVLEMAPTTAPDAHFTYKIALTTALAEAGVKVLVNSKVAGVSDEGVSYTDSEGGLHTLPAGTVIMAAGMRANEASAEKFRGLSVDFMNIGDSVKAANIKLAVRGAYDAAMTF